jgi:hypothetical protein
MATAGALREGWSYASGPRNNETFFRGSASVTGTLVVTVPLPARLVTHAQATLKDTAPVGTDIMLVTVGSYSGNQFTIYCWKATSSSVTTLIAATAAFTVEWAAWANCAGVAGSY